MVRVCFVINFDEKNWLGGANLIINLINSLSKNKKITPILIVRKKFQLKKFSLQNNNIIIVRSNYFYDENIYIRILNKILIHFLGKSFLYESFFRNLNIDILSHCNLCTGSKSSIKSFPWIPDFQFMHYPENFSFKNRILKIINIFFLKNSSTKIILSSKDAQQDLKKISLEAFNKSAVNSFHYKPIRNNKFIPLNVICRKYKIKSKFFYLPNQFFLHKNHLAVLNALQELKKNKRNKNIVVISTGLNRDHRHKDHYQEILSFISKNKLSKNFIYLGVIPYIDVMSFIYHCVAVINPSKFEGWSSSVEQANAISKKIILSNINVHKEQNPTRGYFFEVDNYIKLSKIMTRIWFSHNKVIDKYFFFKNFRRNEKKFLEYGFRYQKVILKS
jgi:hypothetical protein